MIEALFGMQSMKLEISATYKLDMIAAYTLAEEPRPAAAGTLQSKLSLAEYLSRSLSAEPISSRRSHRLRVHNTNSIDVSNKICSGE